MDSVRALSPWGKRPLVGADPARCSACSIPEHSGLERAWRAPGLLFLRMMSREEGAAACFGLVTKRIRKIFRHFPKAKPCFAGLRLPRRPSREVLLLPDCRYTCHQECRSLIQLDCPQGQLSPESTLVPPCSQNVAQTVEEEKPEPPTVQEIKEKIEKYNAKVTNCLLMKLNDDGTYTGFIKVHLKLRRPVTVPAGIRPPSIYDALKEVNLAEMTDKRTSFYLPLDAIKQLHISSTTTVSEVIQGLLKKFMVVDNPQKFALFKEMRKDGQVLFQKLPLTEYPLYLRLLAGPDTDVLSFVLKENETGEVEWDAFSIPELQNFLMILDKEEKDKIQQVHRKYERFKQRLQQTLKEARGKPG